MASPVLGIDLGTTNSVVAVADASARAQVLIDPEGNRLIPSVVSFHPSGDVLVGYPARERRLLDARNTIYSTKRLLGRPFASPEVTRALERFPFGLVEAPNKGVLVEARGQTYTLPEISAFVLREVRRVAEGALGTECTRAVITVPANFTELQRAATKAAGRIAGLEVLRILNEPTAAALAYGYGKGSRERIAVYDLGGGTFDVTILELAGDVFEVMATAGDTYLGGDDIDVMIAEKMADAFLAHHRFDPRQDAQAYERLRAAAEWSKCQLSVEDEVHLRVEELAYGDGGVSLDLTFGLSREALDQMIHGLVSRTFEVCEEALSLAGIRPTQLDNVILVGGSTRSPMVRRMVTEFFGREPLSSIDPDLVVAQGAALQGWALRGASPSIAPSAPLGKVALKRHSSPDDEVLRAALAAEAAQRPAGPAFAPMPPKLPAAKLPSAKLPPPVHRPATGEDPWAARASAEEQTLVRRPSAEFDASPTAPAVPSVVAARAVPVGQVALARASMPPVPPPPVPEASPRPPAPRVAPPAPPRMPSVPPAPEARAASVPPVPPGAVQHGFGAAPRQSREPTAPFHVAPRDAVAPPSGFGELPLPPGLPPALPPSPVSAPPAAATPSFDAAPGWGAAAAPVAPSRPPLLLDVTPLSLGVETVSGFVEPVIKRNAAIPVEQTRTFSTAADMQDSVRVCVTQGESRRREENQALGEIELTGLRVARRGEVKIGVTFLLDADGTLSVKATDLETGRGTSIQVRLVGEMSDAEIEAAAARQQQMMG